MKKLKVLSILLLLILGVSCSKNNNEELSALENKSLKVEDFFEKISKMNLKGSEENNGIYINYEYDSKNKTIKYLNFEEKELDFFPLSSKRDRRYATTVSYSVNCEVDSEGSWDKDCGGKWSCGSLIMDCLGQGGCATVCKNTMVYLPQANEFYIIPQYLEE